MILQIQVFARIKEIVGANSISCEVPEHGTVADLRAGLRQQHNELSSLIDHCIIAIDNEFANDDSLIHANQTIALLPPVSGGEY